MSTKYRAVFDDAHGQPNWGQTGFCPRQRHTTLAGLAEEIERAGGECVSAHQRSLGRVLCDAHLLVMPPPVGLYDSAKEHWTRTSASLLTGYDIANVLRFLTSGGRLLAFGYRFGDAFTGGNLRDLFGPLGCFLHDDAVLDRTRIRTDHPLETFFLSGRELVVARWALAKVHQVKCRPMATFTVYPGAKAAPVLLSPGVPCLSFDRTHGCVAFEQRPIVVAGTYGAGRFALCGGPHLFETGEFGLLKEPGNLQLLRNLLGWLLEGQSSTEGTAIWPILPPADFAQDEWRQLCRVDRKHDGETAVDLVQKMLDESGILRALSRARWGT